MTFQDFSSMPPQDEQQFVPFERKMVETGQKAWRLGGIVAGVFTVVAFIVILAFPAPENPHADAEIETGMAAEPEPAAEEPAPKKSALPAEEKPEPAPAPEAEKKEVAPAPAPKKGRAISPTELVGQ